MIRRPRPWVRPPLALLGAILASAVGCGGSTATLPAPLKLAEVAAGSRTVTLSCRVDEVRYPSDPFPGRSCERVLTLSGAPNDLVIARTNFDQRCADVSAACADTKGLLAVKTEGSVHRVGVYYSGEVDGWSSLVLIEPAGLWVELEHGPGEMAPGTVLERMPDVNAALDQGLINELSGASQRNDDFHRLMADVGFAKLHVPALSDLARACRLDEAPSAALLQADPAATEAVFAGALKPSCDDAVAALKGHADPTVLRALITADAAGRAGLTTDADVRLANLASSVGANDLAGPLSARLVLPEPVPLDYYQESLGHWARLAVALDRLDPEAATPARLAALASAPGPSYARCEAPVEQNWTAASYTGDPAALAVVIATDLVGHDTPATRDALFAIGSDATRGGAARQMARFLLAWWKDPRADQLADVALNSCQVQLLAQPR